MLYKIITKSIIAYNQLNYEIEQIKSKKQNNHGSIGLSNIQVSTWL